MATFLEDYVLCTTQCLVMVITCVFTFLNNSICYVQKKVIPYDINLNTQTSKMHIFYSQGYVQQGILSPIPMSDFIYELFFYKVRLKFVLNSSKCIHIHVFTQVCLTYY